VKFLVDMPLSPELVQWLQHRGHDAVHAAALGLDRAPDTTIIARALLESRTIVTADLDYPRLLAIMQATAPSLILFRDGEWSEADVRQRFGEVLAALTEDDIRDSVVVVERDRIRRRRLPLKPGG
jgi:predicted nuclease of predicted toxin-antitoxin system